MNLSEPLDVAEVETLHTTFHDLEAEVERLRAQVRQLEQLLGDFPDEALEGGEQ